jgi:MYXO-CTERM domain-containing protein
MKPALLLIPLCWASCSEAPPAARSWRSPIAGGAEDDGHPAVGRVLAGSSLRCGGTLVGETTVLTSAHCVEDGEGSLTFALDDGTAIEVANAQKNPDYESSAGQWTWGSGLFHDIAVLDLSEPASTAPLRIYALPPERSMAITLVGFGATACEPADDGGPADAEPTCQGDGVKRVATNTIEQLYAHEFTITGAANACKGDSGGAVLTEIDGEEVVVGMPARGEMPCGQRSYATRLDVHLQWVLQTASGTVAVLAPDEPDSSSPRSDAAGHDATGGSEDSTAGDSNGSGGEEDESLSGGCSCEQSATPAGPPEGLLLLGLLAVAALGARSKQRRAP